MSIHETAIIDKDAEVPDNVEIGPFCVIGPGVTLSKEVKIRSHVVVEGRSEIGAGTEIYPFASIGLPPQDMKYKGEETGLRIGSNTIIRENVTIHRASVGGDGLTEIGDNCFIMAYAHIAHDCKIGKGVIMANAATCAGHVSIGDHAVIGGIVAIHQFTRIGGYTMVGGFSGIGQDIPPYMIASGARAQLFGPNTVGLKRHGFSEEAISELKKAYRLLFREKGSLKDAIRKVQEELPYTDEIRHLIEFINQNKRGICR